MEGGVTGRRRGAGGGAGGAREEVRWGRSVGPDGELIARFAAGRRISRCGCVGVGLGARSRPDAYLENARTFAREVMPALP